MSCESGLLSQRILNWIQLHHTDLKDWSSVKETLNLLKDQGAAIGRPVSTLAELVNDMPARYREEALQQMDKAGLNLSDFSRTLQAERRHKDPDHLFPLVAPSADIVVCYACENEFRRGENIIERNCGRCGLHDSCFMQRLMENTNLLQGPCSCMSTCCACEHNFEDEDDIIEKSCGRCALHRDCAIDLLRSNRNPFRGPCGCMRYCNICECEFTLGEDAVVKGCGKCGFHLDCVVRYRAESRDPLHGPCMCSNKLQGQLLWGALDLSPTPPAQIQRPPTPWPTRIRQRSSSASRLMGRMKDDSSDSGSFSSASSSTTVSGMATPATEYSV